MTREEIIERIERYIPWADEYEVDIEVLTGALELLKKEPCGDLISRQAVLEQTYLWSKDEFLRITNPFDYLRKRINDIPPVNPQEPKTVLEDIKAEIKEWYWQADKQAIAKDPCVVDAMIDLFIRTINAHISGEPQESEVEE